MSILRRAHIRCDGYEELESVEGVKAYRECDYFLPGGIGNPTAAMERAEAAEKGWSRTAGKDYCPRCTTRKAAK